MSDKIQPCPFGGHKYPQVLYIKGRTSGSLVDCIKCGAQGPIRKDDDAAIRSWNKVPELIQGLKNKIENLQEQINYYRD